MKFVDSTLKDKLTRDRIRMGVSIFAVVVLNILVLIGVYTLLDSKSRAERARRNAQADILLEAMESASLETEQTTTVEQTVETQNTDLVPVVASNSETDVSEPSGEAPEQEQATEPAVQTEAEATQDPNAVVEYYAVVYASSDINLRTGPGTDYDVVRVIHVGEQIDVTGRTGSGWLARS